MDFSNLNENIPIFMTIAGLILLQFFLKRRRKPETTHQEIGRSLLSEVRLNQALAESYHLRQKPKRFETVSWQMNKNKLDFLDQALQITLTGAFTMAEDLNRQIEAFKKSKSTSYVISIDTGKIKDSLSKSREGLEKWLQLATGTKELPPKYPGIFDGWLGKG